MNTAQNVSVNTVKLTNIQVIYGFPVKTKDFLANKNTHPQHSPQAQTL